MPSSVETDPRAYAALYRISSLLGRGDSPPETLTAILTTNLEVFRDVSGSIALLNPDSGRLEIEVHHGFTRSPGDVALKLGQGITGWVAFHGRPQIVPDVAADPRYVRVRDDVRSEMAAPMLSAAGQVIGVVNVDSDRPAGFTEADLALFLRLTAEANAVMAHLWQLRHLRTKADQLESLIAVGQTLVAKVEEQELFDTVTRDARQITATHTCALYLCDLATENVHLVSLAGLASTPLSSPVRTPLPLHSCLVGSAVHTRRPVEFANVQSPEFIDVIDLPHDPDLRSLLAVPLAVENEVLGVLAVFTDRVHRFNNDEKRLVGALASLAAVALQNSRLYTRVFQSEASLRKNEQLTTLGLLAAEIAHEIRNPLTVIKLLFGYLNLDFPGGDPRRTDVRVIGEKLDELEAIVSRVLNFAKAPSNLHSRWSVADIIEDTLVLIRLKLSQGKVHLHFHRPDKALVVDVHKGQLQQVLINLLFNATEAMPDGCEIIVTCGFDERVRPAAATQIFIDVTDTGTGIPPTLQDRIFDSFLTGRPDGTGLGLSIAKRILASHHGDIERRATSDAGTTIRLVLPFAKP